MGGSPANYLDTDSFNASISDHLLKVGYDILVVNVSTYTPDQQKAIANYISGLSAENRLRIMVLN